jgi:hypothetical protein
MYEVVAPDPALEAGLLAFHSRAGLVFGADDLILPEEGPVFLECASGGQGPWLEQALDLRSRGPSPNCWLGACRRRLAGSGALDPLTAMWDDSWIQARRGCIPSTRQG